MRIVGVVIGVTMVAAISCYSTFAFAQTSGDEEKKAYLNGKAVNDQSKPDISAADSYVGRNKMDFLLKPGSGLVTQGIPLLVLGVPIMVYGIAGAATWDRGCTHMCLGGLIGGLTIISGILPIAAGAIMIGVGATRNKDFSNGEIDYTSPATAYIAGGAVNTVIGTGIVVGGSLVLKNGSPKNMAWGLGSSILAVGAAYTGYGLGFLIYGATADFEKKAGKQASIHGVFGSLTPFVGCTGGMCDGNTTRATGRETYFAGIRGEF